jgi:hypothetical protein
MKLIDFCYFSSIRLGKVKPGMHFTTNKSRDLMISCISYDYIYFIIIVEFDRFIRYVLRALHFLAVIF